ncbi:hypothetical protein PV377_19010 [Streptomyces ipomoeae]|uniref:hypothetical protein n=1 Tax=Streptomyces ipomoeae TaxID=103232 RepID=UPI0029ADCF81|nr:hypothetical protein [Streptomyces ipomoeae]MDX2841037.1 hypothetical protein [Streptomyces ipomoeae]
MDQHSRTPQPTTDQEPARKPQHRPSVPTGDGGTDDPEALRLAAALGRSSADHSARSDDALGEADAARGRAGEADARGDLGTANAEWSDAAGLDGTAAHEATTADIDARAAAATATSTTAPAAAQGGRKAGPASTGQSRGQTAPAVASQPRRIQ